MSKGLNLVTTETVIRVHTFAAVSLTDSISLLRKPFQWPNILANTRADVTEFIVFEKRGHEQQ